MRLLNVGEVDLILLQNKKKRKKKAFRVNHFRITFKSPINHDASRKEIIYTLLYVRK